MAQAATTDLKVVVSIVQQNASEIQTLLGNLKSLLGSVKDIGAASLSGVQTQIKALGDVAKVTLSNIKTSVADQLKTVTPPTVTQLVQLQGAPESQAKIQALEASVEQLRKALENLKNTPSLHKPGQDAEESAKGVELLNSKVEGLVRGVKFLAGGFLALESIRFLKDLADTAARAQVLGTVLHVVGANMAYTRDQIDQADRQVQRMGITAQASRQSLTQLLQARIPLDLAPRLARASQDLAVVAGENSSTTFQRMIVNIEQLDTVGLRWMGITVDNAEAQRKFQQEMVRTTGVVRELTQQEKQQALALEVLNKAQGLAGAYEAAMGDVGKQISSLERYTTNLKTSLGNNLLPAYLALVEQTTLLIKHLQLEADAFSADDSAAQSFGKIVGFVASALRSVVEVIVDHKAEVIGLVAAYTSMKSILFVQGFFNGLGDNLDKTEKALRGVWKAVSPVVRGMYDLVAGISAEIVAEDLHITKSVASTTAMEAEATVASTLATRFTALAASAGLSTLAFGGLVALLVASVGVMLNVGGSAEKLADMLGGNKVLFGGSDAMLTERKNRAEASDTRLTEATQEYEKIAADPSTPEQLAQAKTKWDAAKKQADDDNKAFYDLIEIRKKANPAMAKLYQDQADRRKKINDLLKVKEDLTNAENLLFGTKTGFTFQGEEISQEYQKFSGALKDLAKGIDTADVPGAAAKLKAGMRDLSNAATTPAALKELPKDLESFEVALAQTRRRQQYGQQLEDLEKARATRLAQLTAQGVKGPAALTQVQGFDDTMQRVRDQADAAAKEVTAANRKAFLTNDDKTFAGQQAENAALVARDAQKAQLARIASDAKERASALSEAQIEVAKEQLEALKGRNALVEAVERDAYEHGLLNQADYFARRRTRMQQEYQKESSLQAAEVTKATRQLAVANQFDNDPAQIQAAQTALKAAKAQQAATKKQNDLSNQQLGIEQRGAAEQTRREVEQLRIQSENSIGGTQGGEDAITEKYRILGQSVNALDGAYKSLLKTREEQERQDLRQQNSFQNRDLENQVKEFYDLGAATEVTNLKFDKMAEQLKKIGVSPAILEQLKNIELFKSGIDLANQAVEKQIALSKSQLDLARQRVASMREHGQLTSEDADAANDAITRQEMRDQRRRIDLKENERQALVDQQTNAIALNIPHTKIDQDIEDIDTQLNGLQADLIRMGDAITDYGKKIRQGFTEGLAGAFRDMLSGTKNAGDSFLDMLKGWQGKIAEFESKRLAENLTRILFPRTPEMEDDPNNPGKKRQRTDENGNPVYKPSVFDGIAKALGLDSEKKQSAADELIQKSKERPVTVALARPGGQAIPQAWDTNATDNPAVDAVLKLPADISQATKEGSQAGTEKGADKIVGGFRGLLQNLAGLFGTVGGGPTGTPPFIKNLLGFASGGLVSGPGTGTSDSVWSRLSHGEFVVRAASVQDHLPLLQSLNDGSLRGFADGGYVDLSGLQSIAMPPLLPRSPSADFRGTTIDQATGVKPFGPTAMMVHMHPDTLNMTMRDFMEREIARQFSRR